MSIEMASNISSEIWPFKQTVLSMACELFETGSTYIPTEDTGLEASWLSWIAYTLKIVTIIIVAFVTTTNLFPNGASRSATLLGLAGSCISSSFIFVYFLMTANVLDTSTASDFQIHLGRQCPIFFLMYFISKLLMSQSTIKLPIARRKGFFTFILTRSIVHILHLFPTYSECNDKTLYYNTVIWIHIVPNIPETIENFYCFVKMINAEKLYIEKKGKIIGYWMKGGSEWFEIQARTQAEIQAEIPAENQE